MNIKNFKSFTETQREHSATPPLADDSCMEDEKSQINNNTENNKQTGLQSGLDSNYNLSLSSNLCSDICSGTSSNLKSSSESSLNTKTDEPNINSTMSKDEINYMIIQLQRQGYQIKQKQKDDSYATAVLKSNGGSSSYPKKIFFSKDSTPNLSQNRKRKNQPKTIIQKNYDNKNFYILLIKKIEKK